MQHTDRQIDMTAMQTVNTNLLIRHAFFHFTLRHFYIHK